MYWEHLLAAVVGAAAILAYQLTRLLWWGLHQDSIHIEFEDGEI